MLRIGRRLPKGRRAIIEALEERQLLTTLAFTIQPSTTAAGSNIHSPNGIQVAVEDGAGHQVNSSDNITIALSANPGGDTLTGTLTEPAVNGVANFPNLVLTKASTGYSLSASDTTNGGVTSAISGTFNITSAAAPTKIVFGSIPASTTAGAAIGGGPGFQVKLEDAYDNLVSRSDSVSISLTSNPGNSALSGTTTATATGGIATFTGISLNKVGTGYALSAADNTVLGVAAGFSAPFNIATASESQLIFTNSPTNTTIGSTLAAPTGMQVTTEDAFGNIVSSGDTITLSLSPSPSALAGTLSAPTSGGVATFPDLSVSTAAIGYVLTASDATNANIPPTTSQPFNVNTPSGFDSLQSFTYGPNGFHYGGLILAGGSLYGTTTQGGFYGDGTVFQLSGPNYSIYTTLVSFSGNGGNAPGANPFSLLTFDPTTGNLFGTTPGGGAFGDGTVFQLSGTNHTTFTSLVSFSGNTGNNPGWVPNGLTLDANGNLFGTTRNGGALNDGTVFELSGTNHATFTSLIAFTGSTGSVKGFFPQSAPVLDSNGNLFGTTYQGGAANDGTAFELSGANHGTFTPLVSFTGTAGTDPGTNPNALIIDSHGNLFGTTNGGGASGDGTVFELSGVNYGTFVSLAVFTGTAGTEPGSSPAGLAFDTNSNLYGTTFFGGASDDGTVFELSGNNLGTFASLVAFTGSSGIAPGANPYSGLAIDGNGNLYSTTDSNGAFGNGSIFEIPGPSHSALTTLLSFSAGSGVLPSDKLVMDSSGNLYGTTPYGGTYDDGTVFELSGPNYSTYSTLVSFTGNSGSAPGANPLAGLLLDTNGNLFGTTSVGGTSGDGTAFELVGANHNFVSLVSFTGNSGATPGASPQAGLIRDASGNLYGTTQQGGAFGNGIVFELSGPNFATFTPLLVFNNAGNVPGSSPNSLAFDSAGILYGTTQFGGTSSFGTVFKLSGTNHTVFAQLVSFTGTAGIRPGAFPQGGLTLDSNGNLFGTTSAGGASGFGTVFELSGANHTTFTPIIAFTGTAGNDPGSQPFGELVVDGNGNLYGTTYNGGAGNNGTVFELTGAAHTTFTTLASFTGNSGSNPGQYPQAGLLIDSNRNLYGTTSQGGAYNLGTAFELTPATRVAFSQQPSPVVAGATIPTIKVNVQDAFSNTVASDGSQITLSIASGPAGAHLNGVTTITAVNGVATFNNLSLTVAGNYTLLASDGSLGAATSIPFAVAAAAASQLSFNVNPTTTTAGTVIDPSGGVQVSVVDAYGNVVSSNDMITLSLSSNPGGTTFSPVTVTAVNGVASFTNLAIDQAASGYQFTANDVTHTGDTAATSQPFTINAAAPAHITSTSGNNQKTNAGTAFGTPLSVQVTDSFGNLVPGASVTFTAPASGAGLASSSVLGTTNSTGSITYIAVADSSIGAYTVTASVSGVSTPAQFQLSNAGPLFLTGPAFYLKLDSDGQTLDVYANSAAQSPLFTQEATNLISSVYVNGSGQPESLTVDFSAGNPLPAIDLNYVGAGTPSTNQLILIGSTGNDAITVSSSQVTFNSTSITYSNIGQLIFTPGTGVASVIVNSGTLGVLAPSGAGVVAENFSTISIANGASLIAMTAASGHSVLVTNSLSIAGTGQLDLTDNDMILRSTSAGDVNSPGTLAYELKTGFNAALGYWNGLGGIVSSSAAGNRSFLTTLGYRAGGNTFDNLSTSTSDSLVKYTYYGDADLSGSVNGADYQQIDLGFGTNATGWFSGDFNYDGIVNSSDFALIDNTFNQIAARGAGPLVLQADTKIINQTTPEMVAKPFTGPVPFSDSAIVDYAQIDVLDKLRNHPPIELFD